MAALLERELRFQDPSGFVSLYLGSAGGPLAASLLTPSEPAKKFLAPLVSRWLDRALCCPETDLMLGSAGALLACAEIEGRIPRTIPPSFSEEMRVRAADSLTIRLALAEETPVCLGLSHGVAGILLALEAWALRSGVPMQETLRSRTLALLRRSAVALPGGGTIWYNESGVPGGTAIHGWCHGGSGIALTLLWGRALSGFPEYDELIEAALIGAARVNSWNSSFCCGSMGRAQALLDGFALTGERRWLAVAKKIARERALLPSHRLRGGFLKGMLGRLYLDWRLAYPRLLPLPGFGGFARTLR